MDLIEEYEDFKQIPVHIAVSYKFFSHFKVDDENRIWFSGNSFKIEQEGVADAIKKFLKASRKEIKEGIVSKGECSRRIWFWYAKIIDFGLFTPEVRQDILRWMDICETVLM